MKQTSSFVAFLNRVQGLSQHRPAQITICTGNDPFLTGLYRSAQLAAWRSTTSANVTTLELEQFQADSFVDGFLQSSLFDPSTMFVCNSATSPSRLVEQINRLSTAESPNRLLLTIGTKPPANLAKLIKTQDRIEHVACTEPAPYEIDDFIGFQAGRCGLRLDPSAKRMIAEYLGRDLSLIANELQRIALTIGDQKNVLTSESIAPHLGLLKEELIFKLRSFILEGQLSKAEALLFNLIERGESGLAILGFLAKHCRSALLVGECLKNKESSNEIMKKSSLQKYLLSSYTNYVRKLGLRRLQICMNQCINIDRNLKTGRANEQLLLGSLIQSLC